MSFIKHEQINSLPTVLTSLAQSTHSPHTVSLATVISRGVLSYRYRYGYRYPIIPPPYRTSKTSLLRLSPLGYKKSMATSTVRTVYNTCLGFQPAAF